MAKLNILSSDPCRDPYCEALASHYIKLISPYMSLQCDFFNSEKIHQQIPGVIDKALENEAGRVERKCKNGGLVVLMSEKGKAHDTMALSKLFTKWIEKHDKVTFVVGSAFGLHDSLYNQERPVLSLSPMTLTHELSLVILLEQLYRLMTLRTSKRYHY